MLAFDQNALTKTKDSIYMLQSQNDKNEQLCHSLNLIMTEYWNNLEKIRDIRCMHLHFTLASANYVLTIAIYNRTCHKCICLVLTFQIALHL